MRRSNSRNLSPSKRSSRSKDGEKLAASGKGPDPAEFDPEFVIGEEDDEPSRAGTPRPKEKAETGETGTPTGNAKEGAEDGKDNSPPALSPEIRNRLRRQEKLEPKYTGRLSVSYHPSFFLTEAQNCSAHTVSPTLVSVPSRLSKHLFVRTLL